MGLLNAMTRESRLHLARVDLNGTSRLPIYKPSVDRVANIPAMSLRKQYDRNEAPLS